MARLTGVVVGMSALALLVAYLAFGWPVLVIGGPLFVGVSATMLVVLVTERPRRALVDRRSGRDAHSPWMTAAERGEKPSVGLMSGFFEISPQAAGPQVPEQQRRSAEPARPARV